MPYDTMKFLMAIICYAMCVDVTTSKIYPNRLPQPCPKSVPNYSSCMLEFFRKSGLHILKGIPEINLRKFNPLDIPFFPLNNTFGEFVGISGALKDLQFWGLDTTSIENYKFDTDTMKGNLLLKHQQIETLLEYDIIGRLLTYKLHGAGFLAATTKDLDTFVTFSLKPYEKRRVKYYALNNFDIKCIMGDGHVTLISTSDTQGNADLISNFINSNPQRGLFLMAPIIDEGLTRFYRSVIQQVLDTVPADEFIPE